VKYFRTLLFVFTATLALPSYGYIDPGTGSLIIQSIIGAIAAIGVTLKLYWHKIKLMLSRQKRTSESADDTTEVSDPPA
jgi:DUF1365 family protein